MGRGVGADRSGYRRKFGGWHGARATCSGATRIVVHRGWRATARENGEQVTVPPIVYAATIWLDSRCPVPKGFGEGRFPTDTSRPKRIRSIVKRFDSNGIPIKNERSKARSRSRAGLDLLAHTRPLLCCYSSTTWRRGTESSGLCSVFRANSRTKPLAVKATLALLVHYRRLLVYYSRTEEFTEGACGCLRAEWLARQGRMEVTRSER